MDDPRFKHVATDPRFKVSMSVNMYLTYQECIRTNASFFLFLCALDLRIFSTQL